MWGVNSGTSPVSWVYQCSHYIAARWVAGGVWSALIFLCWQSAETSSLPRFTQCLRCRSHLYPSRWITDHCQNIYEVSTHQCNYYTFAMLDLNVDSDPNSSNGQKERTAHRMLSTLVKTISLREKSSLFTPQLQLMANKCGAFLQSCPDAPVLRVENLSIWKVLKRLGPKAKLFSKSLRGRWMRWRAKKHAGVREADGSNANLMRKGWGKEALRDLWTNWSVDNCWAQLVEAKKLCRACQLDCTGNMTLAMANIQLKPLLCLQWVFMSRKSFFSYIVCFLVSCFQPWFVCRPGC